MERIKIWRFDAALCRFTKSKPAIQDVALAPGDRVLLVGQTNRPLSNGVWIATRPTDQAG
jgi:hypothetical protein